MKKIYLLILLVLFQAFPLLAAPTTVATSIDALSGSFTYIDPLDNTGTGLGRSTQRVVFQTNDEKYYIAFANLGTSVIYRVSSDKGATWGTATTIITNSYAGSPTNTVIPDLAGYIEPSNNNLYIVNDTGSTPLLNLMRLTYAGSGTWTSGSLISIAISTPAEDNVGIVKDNGNKLWVGITGGTNFAIKMYASTDNGSTWVTNSANLGVLPTTQKAPSGGLMMVLFQNKPVIFYSGNYSTGSIYYRYLNDAGAWTPTTGTTAFSIPNAGVGYLSATEGNVGQVSAAVNNYGGTETLHFAYHNSDTTASTSAICYTRTTNVSTASNWSAVKTIATSVFGRGHLAPKIVTSGSDLYVIWMQFDSGKEEYDMVYSKSTDNGVNWSSPTTLQTTSSPTTFNKVYTYNSAANTFEDKTTAAAGDLTAGDVLHSNSGKLFSYTEDAIYFGSTSKFNNIYSTLSTRSTVFPNKQIVWEYSKPGGTWTALVSDTPQGAPGYGFYSQTFKNSGKLKLWLSTSSGTTTNIMPADWSSETVNGTSNYWVRARLASPGYIILKNAAGTYQNLSTAAGNGTTDDVKHSVSGGLLKDVGDEIYIGADTWFGGFETILSTAGSGGAITWAWLNGTSVSILSTTPANYNFSTAANTFQRVSWAAPTDQVTWNTWGVFSGTGTTTITAKWIRGTVTTGFTTAPIGTKVLAGNHSAIGTSFKVFKVNPNFPTAPAKASGRLPYLWSEDTTESKGTVAFGNGAFPVYNLQADSLLIASAPTVSKIIPANSSNTAAITVTVTGTGFYGGGSNPDVSGVALSGSVVSTLSNYSVLSDTRLWAEVPAGITPGLFDFQVTNTGGTNATSAEKYEVLSSGPPVITTIAPNTGVNTGSRTVTITGLNFH